MAKVYTFTQTVFQIGGGSSEGTLMIGQEAGARPEIKQYFQRHGRFDVEYSDPAEFCKYLETEYYRDDRTIYWQEQADSTRLRVFSTSPYDRSDRELFTLGELVPEGE